MELGLEFDPDPTKFLDIIFKYLFGLWLFSMYNILCIYKIRKQICISISYPVPIVLTLLSLELDGFVRQMSEICQKLWSE